MRFTGRLHGVRGATRRTNPSGADAWIRRHVRAMPWGLSKAEVRERIRREITTRDEQHGAPMHRRTRDALLRTAVAAYTDTHPAATRRGNPGLAILNPLPDHLAEFARDQQLTPDEREAFAKAVGRYCEFHEVSPDDVELLEVDPAVAPDWMSAGPGVRFLVGMGETEDVSYSANAKGAYRNSAKHGTPYRHEFPSKPFMATDPEGQMIFVINKPDGPHFGVSDWIRG